MVFAGARPDPEAAAVTPVVAPPAPLVRRTIAGRYQPRLIPDPCPETNPEWRDWWWSHFERRCAACGIRHGDRRWILSGPAAEVVAHHLRYRRGQKPYDFIPLCTRHHVGKGFVHSTHRERFGHVEPSPKTSGVPHPNLVRVTWRVVRKVRRRSWRRYVGLVPRFPWEGR